MKGLVALSYLLITKLKPAVGYQTASLSKGNKIPLPAYLKLPNEHFTCWFNPHKRRIVNTTSSGVVGCYATIFCVIFFFFYNQAKC